MPDPLQVLSYCVRPVICAPPGKMWVVSDLSSIESRVLGWLSGCTWINGIFARGQDAYKVYASALFGVPYDQVTKDQRNYSKPPLLGCGYRLGGVGLVKYAAGMGVTMTKKEGFRAVKVFRDNAPEIVQMWYWLEGAITSATGCGSGSTWTCSAYSSPAGASCTTTSP